MGGGHEMCDWVARECRQRNSMGKGVEAGKLRVFLQNLDLADA